MRYKYVRAVFCSLYSFSAALWIRVYVSENMATNKLTRTIVERSTYLTRGTWHPGVGGEEGVSEGGGGEEGVRRACHPAGAQHLHEHDWLRVGHRAEERKGELAIDSPKRQREGLEDGERSKGREAARAG